MKIARPIILWIPIFLLTAIQVFPIASTLLSSVRTPQSFLSGLEWDLSHFSLENYRKVVLEDGFSKSLLTSIVVALCSGFASVAAGAGTAYALSKRTSQKVKVFGLALLISRLVPPVAIALPVFLLIQKLSLLDTYLGLILAHTSLNFPFAVWLLLPFFKAIPEVFEQAAALDGARGFSLFWHVVSPLALPGIIVAGVFCFLMSWNDFLFALFLAGSDVKTAPLLVNSYMTGFAPEWGPMSSASLLMLVPVFFFSLILQRKLTAGGLAGGMK
jgi:multiple sugar transport system permease protein